MSYLSKSNHRGSLLCRQRFANQTVLRRTRLLCLALFLCISFPNFAKADVTVLYDPFDNEDLATGGPNAILGGFHQVVINGGGTNGVTEETVDGTAHVRTATNATAEPLWGIVSDSHFDPITDIEGGLIAHWEATAADQPQWTGISLTLQSGAGPYTQGQGRPALLIRLTGNNTGGSGATESLLLDAVDSSNTRHEYASVPFDTSELADGFTVTLVVNQSGWVVVATDLLIGGADIEAFGTWSLGFEPPDLLDSESYVGAYIQRNVSDGSGRDLYLDSMTLSRPCLFIDGFESGDTAAW